MKVLRQILMLYCQLFSYFIFMKDERKEIVLSAELENIAIKQKSSINVGVYKDAYFRRGWHYHPEFELLLITNGYGTRMVGDHFEQFKKGDLVLLGANLPHAWVSDPYFLEEDNVEACESIYIQFRKSVFGTHFIDIPELNGIRVVLAKAQQGIKVSGIHEEEIKDRMMAISEQAPLEQLLNLIRLLDLIFNSEYEVLASRNYMQQGIFKSKKMTEIHNYMIQNFKNEISINSCAEHIGMTTTSFCRFFKKQTNVTFSVYLNYLRINFAQKLIRNSDLPMKEIAYQCGYESVVYFNQKFKKLTGLSPREYRS